MKNENPRPAGDTQYDAIRSGEQSLSSVGVSLVSEQDTQGDCIGAWTDDMTNKNRGGV